MLPAGNYVIPFTIQLDPKTIQSFSHEWLQGGQNCYLRVSHKVYFLLESSVYKNLIYKKERFFVYDFDKINMPLSSAQQVSFSDTIKKSGFGNHGSFQFSLKVDRRQYKKGEAIRVHVDIDLAKLDRKVTKIGCILAQNVSMNGKAAPNPGDQVQSKYKSVDLFRSHHHPLP